MVLADGFDIRDGQVQVTVPLVITGSTYSFDRKHILIHRDPSPKPNLKCTVWGDSGNWSPEFTINGVVP